MFTDFPANHPFAHYTAYTSTTYPISASSSSTALSTPHTTVTPAHPRPSITGPVPPRRVRPRPSHTRSDSTSTVSSSTSASTATLLLTPTTSRCASPFVATEESEGAFFARLSTVSKHFGTSSRRSSRASTTAQETPDFEVFVAGLSPKSHFGSVAQRGGEELAERHERVAERLAEELQEVEVRSAVRVAL